MVRLSLIALPFLASLVGVAAQPPACSHIAVALKASKQVRLGGSTWATFSMTNTGSTAMSDLIVGITLPPQYLAPKMTVQSLTKPPAQAQYVAPSAVWTSVTVPARKTLRFKVKAKTNKCDSYATSLQINAAAYMVDSQSALVCYSGADPATVKVATTKHSIVACPTPPPGPVGPVSVYAVNQIIIDGTPQRRALTEGTRQLTARSLEECTERCSSIYRKPFYVGYNAQTFACSCCQNTVVRACARAVGCKVPSYDTPLPLRRLNVQVFSSRRWAGIRTRCLLPLPARHNAYYSTYYTNPRKRPIPRRMAQGGETGFFSVYSLIPICTCPSSHPPPFILPRTCTPQGLARRARWEAACPCRQQQHQHQHQHQHQQEQQQEQRRRRWWRSRHCMRLCGVLPF